MKLCAKDNAVDEKNTSFRLFKFGKPELVDKKMARTGVIATKKNVPYHFVIRSGWAFLCFNNDSLWGIK